MISITTSFNIQTFLGDIYGENFNSPTCILKGHVFYAFINALYYSFVNQAFYRYCRILYPMNRWFQLLRVYLIIFFVELLLINIILSVQTYIWYDIIYLNNEYYCLLDYKRIRSVIWVVFNIYAIPLSLIIVIYFRVGRFLRRQQTNHTLMIKQRQQRDFIILRRIIIIIGILIILGVPTIVLIFVFFITGEMHPLFHRVMWFAVNLSAMTLSISLAIVTPQLKNMIWKKFQQTQIIPLPNAITNEKQMRHNTIDT
ncbi:unnamed protein product [Adineta ricciae]|uniref:G-protein coupled receptors family 1 profile domain-containing protein n=1 Tax=Adineta ricciae TaxID=249248 RepID=A0A815IKZ2_ADIRI|nr:unnamed protein product [Adineta ricciae]